MWYGYTPNSPHFCAVAIDVPVMSASLLADMNVGIVKIYRILRMC